jgi:hypothetical protein
MDHPRLGASGAEAHPTFVGASLHAATLRGRTGEPRRGGSGFTDLLPGRDAKAWDSRPVATSGALFYWHAGSGGSALSRKRRQSAATRRGPSSATRNSGCIPLLRATTAPDPQQTDATPPAGSSDAAETQNTGGTTETEPASDDSSGSGTIWYQVNGGEKKELGSYSTNDDGSVTVTSVDRPAEPDPPMSQESFDQISGTHTTSDGEVTVTVEPDPPYDPHRDPDVQTGPAGEPNDPDLYGRGSH